MRDDIKLAVKNSKDAPIDLGEKDITDDQLENIMQEIIKTQPNVKSIFLNKNKITDAGAIILGKKLAELKELTHIDLQFNRIDRKGAAALVALRRSHPGLKIALYGNYIIDEGEMKKIENKVLKKS